MKMIAFYNNKGGVGKTSTAINIAYTLSRRKNRVLLIDFDGQCNSSRFFTDLTNDESGCERAIISADEKPMIKKTRYDNIDIVTSSVRMNAISNEFVNLSDEEKLIIKDDNTIGFEFPERLKCPICGKEMVKSSKGWVCTGYRSGCSFFIAGTICGKCITETIAAMLCANKRTRIINGFTSKAGKQCHCVLYEDLRTKLY